MGPKDQADVILRRVDERAASVPEVADHLGRTDGVAVINSQESNLLVRGDRQAIEAVADQFPGWRAFPRTRIDVPNTRARVLRPPR